MPDELRDLLALTIRRRVRLTIGPRATRMLAEGNPVLLSGREADDAADAALAALAEHGLTVVDCSDQTGDLRHRYAEAATVAHREWVPSTLENRSDRRTLGERIADAILAVRDVELERLRAQLPQCNGVCLRASDVLDDLSRVVGNPVAHAHRSCPLHGDLEAAASELDAALGKVEAERDGWRERAEKAEAALARVRYLAEDWATLPPGTYTRAGKGVLAALDAEEPPHA